MRSRIVLTYEQQINLREQSTCASHNMMPVVEKANDVSILTERSNGEYKNEEERNS